MKIGRVAALVAAFPGFALAQNVTLYGVVDTGVAYVNGVGAARHSDTFMQSGAVPSRWGLRGTEDLGGGNKAVFWLESGFASDTGAITQGGRLFGRQALVGLSGDWGQVAFGRQFTMLFWGMAENDLLGPNIFGSASLDVYTSTARADNAVSYKGTFGGLTIGGTYSFGRDTVNGGPSPSGTNCAGENPADSRQCREWSALVKYGNETWNISAAYDSIRGGPGAFAGLTSSSLKDDRMVLGGQFIVGKVQFGGGWLRRDNRASTTSRSDLFYGGVSYSLTPAVTLESEIYHQRIHNSPNKAWLFAGRALYAFSKRTTAYGTVGYINNFGNSTIAVNSGQSGTNPKAGGNQLGAMIGVKHIF